MESWDAEQGQGTAGESGFVSESRSAETPYFQDERVTVYGGDCLEVMPTLDAESFDAVITDPPYHLTSIVQRFGKEGSAAAKGGSDGRYTRLSRGFMGTVWDGGDIAFRVETWRAAWRLLKPGGHLIAMGGSRTFHRVAVAIEDAGFEIRDCLSYLYGSGFPKSHQVGDGWGTALKPAWEPIILARKPLKGTVARNVERYGVGAINVAATRIGGNVEEMRGRSGVAQQSNRILGKGIRNPTDDVWEPNTAGRWPANVVLDEEAAALLDKEAGERPGPWGSKDGGNESDGGFGGWAKGPPQNAKYHGDSTGASRFFYTAKASASERQGVTHPTVKPVALMRWLCRLVTPPNGHILDPFAGTGTTRLAALAEGFRVTLIEQNPDYLEQLAGRVARLALPLESAS